MTDADVEGRQRPIMVVTGVAGLIGRQIAEVLSEDGVDVIGVDVTAPQSGMSTHRARTMKVDITDEQAVRAAAKAIRDEYGAIEALVHAAAVTGRSPSLQRHSLRSVDLDLWRRVLEVNVTGALLCAREFGALLRPGPRAQILLVGSIQGLVPTMGASAYAVSKAALVGLVRQLAAEFAADGVRVNLVSPGPVADDRELARLRAEGVDDSPTPMGRFGGPREIAESIVEMTIGSFSLLTGAVVPIDGGEHLRPRTGPRRAHGQADRHTEPEAGG